MKKLISGLSLMLFMFAAVVAYAAPDGAALYKSNCASCHGPSGDQGVILNTQSPDDLMKKLKGYADGTYGGDKKAVMINVVKKHNEDELKAITDFVGKK